MKLYEKAIRIAVEAHAGQFDKAGMPYILHPIRVSEAVSGEDAKCVAVLHDVVEDTDFSLTHIRLELDDVIGDGVLAMTKLEKMPNERYESYREYLDRVRSNDLAKQVKLADMVDNSRPERLSYLSVEKHVRLASKYARGRHYLLTGEWYENKDLDKVIKAGYNR